MRPTHSMPMTSANAPSTTPIARSHINLRLLILLLLAVVWVTPAQAQGTLAPVAQQVFLDNSGLPLNGGKVCTYLAGTTTPQPTYSDLTLLTPNSNPIILNSAGRPTTGGVYFSPISYKILVLTAGTDSTCATGTTIYTQDNVGAVPATAVGLDVTGIAGTNLTAGQIVYLSDGSGGNTAGRWYVASSANNYSSSAAGIVGVATAAITSAASGTIRIGGRATGLSALVAGTQYFVGTAGALTSTRPTNTRFVGSSDSTTTLDMGANPARTEATLLPNNTAEGRLTATTAVPVTTGDVSGATAIFYTPYTGNHVALYTGTNWIVDTFTEITISVTTCTASKPFDVFLFDNATAVNAEILAWTNDTTRATALVRQDGILVKTGALTRRYIGSFYCNASGGQTDDTAVKRWLYNYYNRVQRPMQRIESANTWTYTTATYRQANANTANQLDVMNGVAEEGIEVTVNAIFVNNNANVSISASIGESSTTAPVSGVQGQIGFSYVASDDVQIVSTLRKIPPVGRVFYTWLEFSTATGTTTWSGNEGSATRIQSGISGMVRQ